MTCVIWHTVKTCEETGEPGSQNPKEMMRGANVQNVVQSNPSSGLNLGHWSCEKVFSSVLLYI